MKVYIELELENNRDLPDLCKDLVAVIGTTIRNFKLVKGKVIGLRTDAPYKDPRSDT